MSIIPQVNSTNTDEFVVSVSPKGQITMPKTIRLKLGVKPKDKVAVKLEGGEVTVVPVLSSLESIYQMAGSLKTKRSEKETADAAWEEHVKEVEQEGL